MVKAKRLLTAAALVAFWLSPVRAATADILRIGIAPQSSASFGIAEKAAGIASRERPGAGRPGAAMTYVVVETGGVVDNLRRLDRGQVDAALVSLSALRDQSPAGIRDLRVLEFIVVAPQVVYATEESGLTSIDQLEGRAVIPGNAGSGTERTTMEVFALLGIEPNWVRMASDQVAGAIRERQGVAFAKAMGSTAAAEYVEVIDIQKPLRQLDLSAAQQAILRERAPSLRLVPFDAQTRGVAWADPMAIVASPRMPDAEATRYAKALRTVLEDMGIRLDGLRPSDLPDIRFHPSRPGDGKDDAGRHP